MKLTRLMDNETLTLGQLLDDQSVIVCKTLELPDKGNQHTVSRIPAGTYICRRYHSPKRGYDVFELQDVPGRDAIEIHIGNWPKNTDGCVLVGTSFGVIDGELGVTDSHDAFAVFMSRNAGRDMFELTITDPPPPFPEN